MTTTASTSRREFLKQTAVLAAPLIVPASVLGRQDKPAPNSRITLGVIGTGNQGFNDMRGFLGDSRVQIVAVCDVNREGPGYWNGAVAGREPGRRLVEQHYAEAKKSGSYKGCDAYVDFRELLARKDIDAVLICTPDHWHAIPTILAAKAGKDIYGDETA
jgi:predicted dehydrogenase